MLRKICQDEIEEFYRKLYRPYITELKRLGGGEGMALPVLIYQLCQGNMEALVIRKDNNDIGFILVEHIDTALYRPMLFLAEMYVQPLQRCEGVGSEAFKELLGMTDKPIFLTVLPKNKRAKAFWRKMIRENNLVMVRPDKGQIKFAGQSLMFCFSKKGLEESNVRRRNTD